MIFGSSPGGQLPSAYRSYSMNFHIHESPTYNTSRARNTGNSGLKLNFTSSEALLHNEYRLLSPTREGVHHQHDDVLYSGAVDNIYTPSPSRCPPLPQPVAYHGDCIDNNSNNNGEEKSVIVIGMEPSPQEHIQGQKEVSYDGVMGCTDEHQIDPLNSHNFHKNECLRDYYNDSHENDHSKEEKPVETSDIDGNRDHTHRVRTTASYSTVGAQEQSHLSNEDTLPPSIPSSECQINKNDSNHLQMPSKQDVSSVEKAILSLLRKSSNDKCNDNYNGDVGHEAIMSATGPLSETYPTQPILCFAPTAAAVAIAERNLQVSAEMATAQNIIQLQAGNDPFCKETVYVKGTSDEAINAILPPYPTSLVPLSDPIELSFLTKTIETLERSLEHERTIGRQQALDDLASSYESKILEMKDENSRRVLYYVNRVRDLEGTIAQMNVEQDKNAILETQQGEGHNDREVIITEATVQEEDQTQIDDHDLEGKMKTSEEQKKEISNQHIITEKRKAANRYTNKTLQNSSPSISRSVIPPPTLSSLAEESMAYDDKTTSSVGLPSDGDYNTSECRASPSLLPDVHMRDSIVQPNGLLLTERYSTPNRKDADFIRERQGDGNNENNERHRRSEGDNFKSLEKENVKLKHMVVRLVEKVKSLSGKQQQQYIEDKAVDDCQHEELVELKRNLKENEHICDEQRGTIEILLTKNTEFRNNNDELTKTLKEMNTEVKQAWIEAQSSRAVAVQREIENKKYLSQIETMKMQLSSLLNHDTEERAKIDKISSVYMEQCNALTEEMNILRRQNSELLLKSIQVDPDIFSSKSLGLLDVFPPSKAPKSSAPDGGNISPVDYNIQNIPPISTDVDHITHNNINNNNQKSSSCSISRPMSTRRKLSLTRYIYDPDDSHTDLTHSSPSVRRIRGKLYDIDVSPKVGEGGPTAVGLRKHGFSLPS